VAIADELGLEEVFASALNTVGTARFFQGDENGRADVERSLEIALAAGSWEAQRSYTNLGSLFYGSGDLRRALGYYEKARDLAARVGDVGGVHSQEGSLVDLWFHAGRWDEAHKGGERLLVERATTSPNYSDIYGFTARALMWLASGDAQRAASDAAQALGLGRSAKDPQVFLLALGVAARVEAEVGTRDNADVLIAEFLAYLRGRTDSSTFRDVVWAALRLGQTHKVHEALGHHGAPSVWLDACRAALDQSFEEAADLYKLVGSVPNEAYARVRGGEKLLADGRAKEARSQLTAALDFYRRVGALAYVSEAEELLAAAGGLEIPA
jgi:tetratricopeptide (TPR) repeat protein